MEWKAGGARWTQWLLGALATYIVIHHAISFQRISDRGDGGVAWQ
jgi:hypothetical protein